MLGYYPAAFGWFTEGFGARSERGKGAAGRVGGSVNEENHGSAYMSTWVKCATLQDEPILVNLDNVSTLHCNAEATLISQWSRLAEG
jgi:hypothetical protein